MFWLIVSQKDCCRSDSKFELILRRSLTESTIDGSTAVVVDSAEHSQVGHLQLQSRAPTVLTHRDNLLEHRIIKTYIR